MSRSAHPRAEQVESYRKALLVRSVKRGRVATLNLLHPLPIKRSEAIQLRKELLLSRSTRTLAQALGRSRYPFPDKERDRHSLKRRCKAIHFVTTTC